MPTTEAGTVLQEIMIAASPETIFEFFTDPDKMVRWKGHTAQLDPRPGGLYRVEMTDVAIARGEYVEIVPPERIVFTWGWEGEGHPVPPGSSTVEVSLIPLEGATLVRLVHMDLPGDQVEPHNEGWSRFMPRLQAVLEGRDPGPRPYESD